MSTIGARLRKERERLGLSQEAFGALGGVGKRAQINYESDERFGDSAYLQALSHHDVDISYVITGERSVAKIRTSYEAALCRQAMEDVQAQVEGGAQILEMGRAIHVRYNELYTLAEREGLNPWRPLSAQEEAMLSTLRFRAPLPPPPGRPRDPREASLLERWEVADEKGRDVIERIALLEANRVNAETKAAKDKGQDGPSGSAPDAPGVASANVRGHGNVVGNAGNLRGISTTVSIGGPKKTKQAKGR